MNIYKYLEFDPSQQIHKSNILGYSYLMNNKQQKFCDDLTTDIPEIIEYMKSYNGEHIIYLHPRNNDKIIDVHITTNEASSSSYHLFSIFNLLIHEYPVWGILDRHNLSYNQEKNLQPIVKDWLIKYEINILRKLKLKRLNNIL